jgi:hypothetical protein
MTALTPSRHSRLDLLRSRPVLVALAILVLVAVAIPLGLKTIHGSGSPDLATVGSSSGSAFAESGAEPASPPVARDSAGQAPSDAAGGTGAPASGANGKSTDGLGAAAGALEPKLARSAWLGMRVTNLTTASAQARAIATSAGGRVTSENIVTAADPTGGYGVPAVGSGTVKPGAPEDAVQPVGVDQARMTLSVPEEKLDGALVELSRVGTVAYRSSQTEDVTDIYVDVKARIEPAQESIDQVRRLMTQAKDLQQIILLEQELNRRQADLDSLTQQLASLEQRTTMSDVTLTMWTDQTAPTETGNGFLDGLRNAWDGLLGSLTVILTGLAALLPWLLVLGLLAWFGLRIYRRRTQAAAPAATAPAATSASAPAATAPAAPATSDPTPSPGAGPTP